MKSDRVGILLQFGQVYKCKHVLLPLQSPAFCYFCITEKQDLISQEVKQHALLEVPSPVSLPLPVNPVKDKLLFTQMKSRSLMSKRKTKASSYAS